MAEPEVLGHTSPRPDSKAGQTPLPVEDFLNRDFSRLDQVNNGANNSKYTAKIGEKERTPSIGTPSENEHPKLQQKPTQDEDTAPVKRQDSYLIKVAEVNHADDHSQNKTPEFQTSKSTSPTKKSSPIKRHASYRVNHVEDGQDSSAAQEADPPGSSQMVHKELTMITRELSMIARKGTMMTLLGREHTMSTPGPTRNGLVSRLSILPAAFTSPVAELKFDSLSGASMLLLSFIYQHSPSVQSLVDEVAFLPIEPEDDDLKMQIEMFLNDKHFLFPNDCFSHDSSISEGNGVKVRILPLTSRDEKSNKSAVTRKISMERSHKSSKGSGKTSNYVSTLGDDNDNLPMVTPRAILLTPEPKRVTPFETGSTNQTHSEPKDKARTQVMVCLRAKKERKKNQAVASMDYCLLKSAYIQELFHESLDSLGLDFFYPLKHKTQKGKVVHELNDSDDIFIVMETSAWPEVAKKWFQRQRNSWPSAEIIAEIKETCCHVSAFPKKSSDDNTYLRQSFYTFPEVDNILFSSLSRIQRIVFILVSVLYRKHLQEPKLLNLCHIKALFFWLCEKTPPDFWKESELAMCVFHVLNQLIEAVSSIELKHYITEENMLLGTDPEIAREVSDMIRLVRKTPIESLVNSELFGPNEEQLFEPILNYMMHDKKNQSVKESLSCLIQTARNVGKVYVLEGRKDQAVRVLDDACAKMFQFRHFSEESIAMVRVTCDLCTDLCDLDQVIEYTENMAYIAYEYECEYLDLSFCLSRLASLYHCKARQQETQKTRKTKEKHTEDEIPSDVWLMKAQEYFDLALLEDFSLVSVLHYAIYLIKQNNLRDAIVKLTDALALTDESDEEELFADITVFTLLDVEVLDDDLALEVKVMGKVKAPTVVLAYYQLCRAILAAKIRYGLEEYVCILEILADCESNSLPHASWALLGYVKKCRGDRNGASKAFRNALSKNQGYSYLLRNEVIGSDRADTCKGTTCCQIL